MSRGELENLFKNAYSLIYPTLNEGFGYPVLESLKYGVPVVASGIGPIPEIGGSCLVYFNPFIIEDIKIKMLQVINDKELFHPSIIEKRINQFKQINKRQEKDLDNLIQILIS